MNYSTKLANRQTLQSELYANLVEKGRKRNHSLRLTEMLIYFDYERSQK